MNRPSPLTLAALAAALAACGADPDALPDDTGTGSMVGTVAGNVLEVKSGLMTQAARADGSEALLIRLSNFEKSCPALGDAKAKKGSAHLDIVLFFVENGKPGYPIGPGEYVVFAKDQTPNEKAAEAVFFKYAADTCTPELPEGRGAVVSGKVKLTEFTNFDTGAVGSYEFDLADGDRITGEFSVKNCPTNDKYYEDLACE